MADFNLTSGGYAQKASTTTEVLSNASVATIADRDRLYPAKTNAGLEVTVGLTPPFTTYRSNGVAYSVATGGTGGGSSIAVIDNLTSADPASALSARQGSVLQMVATAQGGAITTQAGLVTNHEARIVALEVAAPGDGGASLTGPTPGPLPAYLGSVVGRSNPMKSGGYADTFSFCAVQMLERCNALTLQYSFHYGAGEYIKADTSLGYTQGTGTIRGAVILQDGVAYDCAVGVCEYGDLIELASPTLPRYFQPGEFVQIGTICHQVSHNDTSGGGAKLPGSFMMHSAIGPGDRTWTSGSGYDPAVWLSALRSGTVPTTLAGGTRTSIAVFPVGVLGLTTKPTLYWQGSSRDQGTDTNGGAGDSNMPMSGQNGEGPKLVGFHFGMLNGGINAEGLRHIVDASNINARKKMAARCSHFVVSGVVNDIGSNPAMANPLTAVATMKSECDRVQALFGVNAAGKPRIVTASRPSCDTSDTSSSGDAVFATQANVRQGGFWQAWKDINNAARQRQLGNIHHFEIEGALTTGIGSGRVRVPANARINTTVACTVYFNRPDRPDNPGAILAMASAFWTPEDEGSTVLIDGAGVGGTLLLCQIGTRQDPGGNFDTAWANLYFYKGFKNKLFQVESQFGGTVSTSGGVRHIDIAISSGTRMYVGGLQYTVDKIHSSPMGEDLLMPYNAAAGLLRLPGMS